MRDHHSKQAIVSNGTRMVLQRDGWSSPASGLRAVSLEAPDVDHPTDKVFEPFDVVKHSLGDLRGPSLHLKVRGVRATSLPTSRSHEG